jgi:uncharacterized protein
MAASSTSVAPLQKEKQPATPFTSAGLPSPKTTLSLTTLGAALLLSYVIFSGFGLKQGILYTLGILLGYTLFHARFGFTSAFRQLLSVGQGEGLRAHMLMMAVACLLFAPILSLGIGFFGTKLEASVEPLGVSLVVGSFLFGIGMQLGGGCASGTLYAAGGGRTAAFLTLAGFIAGSVIGAYHWEFWTKQMPSLPAFSLAENTPLGYGGALVVQLAVFGIIAWLTVVVAKRKNPPVRKPLPTARGWVRIVRGSWPLWAAAILLAVLNAVTLTVKGEPWGITSAFALWGSKAAQAMGIDVASWGYWSGERAAALHSSVFADATSVMDFGLVLGALLASSIGGVFTLSKLNGRLAVGSIIGGLLMGYGARLAYGCNIGAYFAGIASFSLHGWVWMILALAGSVVGMWFRPLFGMKNPKPTDSVC